MSAGHLITVEKGTLEVSADRAAILATRHLGGCLAIVVHDAARGAGGMAHVISTRPRRSGTDLAHLPGLFVETAIPRLVERLIGLGCERSRLTVTVVGGGVLLDGEGTPLQLGTRLMTVVRKLLWREGLLLSGVRPAERHSLSVTLRIDSGELCVCPFGKGACI